MSEPLSEPFLLEIDGECPICERATRFIARGPWLRGTLICTTCKGGSVPRERALALVLNRYLPHWRSLRIHESSPAERGISLKMRQECADYLASHFYSQLPLGSQVNQFRNEDIENQTFADASFDLVVTLDVFEHVFRPDKMIREIYRTLKSGGYYISTFPIRKHQIESHKPRVKLKDGEVIHLEEPEYHGNPIDGSGALVTFDYGYTIHQMLAYWVPFEVEISRFCNRHFGILGEYTEVIVCRKPGSSS